MYKLYTKEPEYTKETITAEQLSKLTNRWESQKFITPKQIA